MGYGGSRVSAQKPRAISLSLSLSLGLSLHPLAKLKGKARAKAKVTVHGVPGVFYNAEDATDAEGENYFLRDHRVLRVAKDVGNKKAPVPYRVTFLSWQAW
jgi:hypothetical protein